MREFRFWFRERRKRQRLFACPVCHLEMSLNDLDKDGYTVCPVCGVVLEVVMSAGYPLPVVHDVEIKRAQPRYRIHANSTHLSVGLLPVSMLFSVAAFLMGFLFPCHSVWVEQSAFALFILSLIGSFLSFGSGYLDWKRRYRSRPYQQIDTKIKLSVLFWGMGLSAVAIRWFWVADAGMLSVAFFGYLALQAIMLVLISVIGHIGGNLVFGK
ncbi:MAG: hypothetical protein A2293_05810 [Elusimicrobia bacterium RIFOXYB2_FULL_49_7]|nr:MAG: hypothetical protein A2293_05810 [Elusimicrobia bacterium RIFOXYB2_FULL_49_7]